MAGERFGWPVAALEEPGLEEPGLEGQYIPVFVPCGLVCTLLT